MNMFARFDENPAMTLQDIKETKRYGRTDARTDTRTDTRTDAQTDNVKTVYPPQTKFAGGYNKGFYMSAHVLLNLLNELGKRDKMRGLSSILSLFRNEFNKFNNTIARMLDSIYHMMRNARFGP